MEGFGRKRPVIMVNFLSLKNSSRLASYGKKVLDTQRFSGILVFMKKK